MSLKNLYLKTIGCQMNVYDSDQIANKLKPLGYRMTTAWENADLIIANTCTIREKAEQKAFSFLGRLASLKRKRPDIIIGIGGCLAQQEGKKILERMPQIDLVFGTHAISRLPQIISRLESQRFRLVDIEMSETIDEFEPVVDLQAHQKVTSFVTIMQGCDNYCTYCVVPYVRGRETSRDPDSIVSEIKSLVNSGVSEVTLLGQNVNSYGKKEGLCSFSNLLSILNRIDGLKRIRFTTSHPKDLSFDLINSFDNLNKLCHHIHLPLQSGANRILKRMHRKYSIELYLKKIEELRKLCPDIAITSDIIAGFPGETESDFKETIDVIKEVEFDGLYAFMYSDRPNALSIRFPGKISEPVKQARLQRILDVQEQFTLKKNMMLVGSTELVLVEGVSKKQSGAEALPENQDLELTGRTFTNKIVNFNCGNSRAGCGKEILGKNYIGKMVNIRIEKAFSHSLRGTLVKKNQSILV